MKPLIIQEGVHMTEAVICMGGKKKDIIKEINRHFKEDVIEEDDFLDPKECDGVTTYLDNKGKKIYFVMVYGYKNTPYYQSVLCHELLHLTIAVLRDHGVRCNQHTEESFCYLLQFYMKACLLFNQSKK